MAVLPFPWLLQLPASLEAKKRVPGFINRFYSHFS